MTQIEIEKGEWLYLAALLPAGILPPNPSELLQRASFSLLVRELLDKFDYVVVDTPAASQGSDARIIAAHCGASPVRNGRARAHAGSRTWRAQRAWRSRSRMMTRTRASATAMQKKLLAITSASLVFSP